MYPNNGYVDVMDVFEVQLSAQAKRDLRKVPSHIIDKFQVWVESVEREGLTQVQKIPGFHDEPLKGQRRGQRSIRLNKAYRAIYVINNKKEIEFILVEEVSKHEY